MEPLSGRSKERSGAGLFLAIEVRLTGELMVHYTKTIQPIEVLTEKRSICSLNLISI